VSIRLPERLDVRTRRLTDHPPGDGPVVYWMRTAARAHENAALDVAILAARELGRPVFVYHALSERYRYASDRHHRFILEGARDVAAELGRRGIATAFHLERPGHRGPHLRTLAERAALVITEEMPVAPLRQWTRHLADGIETPLWAVDTATVVPMRVVGKGVQRAYRYRQRVEPRLDAALAPWPEVEVGESDRIDLPFEPVDLASADLDELGASCDIDHAVPAVEGTVGGSVAGYRRWETFRDEKLSGYARTRNDPVLEGTSRLSAYLHYGMVAPTRIAREARDAGGRGAKKFVDELVVWRELAYTWCLYARHHEGLEALPDWARATLMAHASDPRPLRPSLDQLHRGTTGVALWDLAQRSLVRWGELHNNVRMTWGKALLTWTDDPAQALATMIDLNHRYALDGRDPASYGGLLWCLGQFDRPFGEQPVWGTVRSRSISRHAKRLNLARWGASIQRPRDQRVAIVGAGLAGAHLGRILGDHGVDVTLFDKGRGPGGRTSSRRHGDERFRHGAPQLHIHDRRLEHVVAGWVDASVLARDGDALVATPSNALVRYLLDGQQVHFGQRVTGLAQGEGGWSVQVGDESHDGFDQVVVTVPAPQAVPLLADHPLAEELAAVRYLPRWVAMVELPQAAPAPEVADDAVVEQVVGDGRAFALHATAAWSEAHLEDDRDTIAEALIAAVRGLDGSELTHRTAHRWRYAQVSEPLSGELRADPEAGLVVAGDLFGGGANGALVSAAAAAGWLLRPRDRDTGGER